MKHNLISKNVTINGRRTSLRLEEEIWEALNDICRNEGLTIHELCGLVDGRRANSSRTSAVRTFIVAYFRIAANGPSGKGANPGLSRLMGTIRAKSTPRGGANRRN